MRELVHLLGQHHKAHHRAEERNCLAEKKQAVVARDPERRGIDGEGAEKSLIRTGGRFRYGIGLKMRRAVRLLRLHFLKYNLQVYAAR